MLSTRDTFAAATQSLLAHPLRSGLTMLGVIIGNTAFIVMASLGESAKQYTVQRLETFHGPNRLIAYASSPNGNQQRKDPKLYLSDAEALARGIPAIKAVGPVAGQMFFGQVRDRGMNIWVCGTTSGYLMVKNETVALGRFFTQSEVEQRARVVVLGSKLASQLFTSASPLGHSLRLKNSSFKVIGVMREKGSDGKKSPDEFAYIPLPSFVSFLRGNLASHEVVIDYIEIGALSKEAVGDAIFQATNMLQARRGIRDFVVEANVPYSDMISNVSTVLALFLAILACISLLIGGIGIMNVMLVTVSERTSEIGLRKAIGAHRSAIMLQFLYESSLLSMLGGLTGVFVGLTSVSLVALLTPLPFVLPLWSIGSSLLLSTVVGLISGVLPAIRAAKLDPILALKS